MVAMSALISTSVKRKLGDYPSSLDKYTTKEQKMKQHASAHKMVLPSTKSLISHCGCNWSRVFTNITYTKYQVDEA